MLKEDWRFACGVIASFAGNSVLSQDVAVGCGHGVTLESEAVLCAKLLKGTFTITGIISSHWFFIKGLCAANSCNHR